MGAILLSSAFHNLKLLTVYMMRFESKNLTLFFIYDPAVLPKNMYFSIDLKYWNKL
jgi:hypothetical protein